MVGMNVTPALGQTNGIILYECLFCQTCQRKSQIVPGNNSLSRTGDLREPLVRNLHRSKHNSISNYPQFYAHIGYKKGDRAGETEEESVRKRGQGERKYFVCAEG